MPQDIPNPDIDDNVRQPDIPCVDVPVNGQIADQEQADLEDHL